MSSAGCAVIFDIEKKILENVNPDNFVTAVRPVMI